MIQWQTKVSPSFAVLVQHNADSVQRIVFAIRGWFVVGQCNIILALTLPLLHTNCTQTDSLYFIILDGVSHSELIPLHLPSFSAFIRPLKQYQ